MGISAKHTLAIVDRGGATNDELVAFAREIARGLRERFAIALRPEAGRVGIDW